MRRQKLSTKNKRNSRMRCDEENRYQLNPRLFWSTRLGEPRLITSTAAPIEKTSGAIHVRPAFPPRSNKSSRCFVIASAHGKNGQPQWTQRTRSSSAAWLSCGCIQEVVQFLFGLLAVIAIPLLQLADHFLNVALNLGDIIVCQFSPSVTNFALELVPFALKNVCVH